MPTQLIPIAVIYAILLLIAGLLFWRKPGQWSERFFQGILLIGTISVLFLVVTRLRTPQEVTPFYMTDLGDPLVAVPDPLDDNRWFVADQRGIIWIIEHGVTQDQPFFNLLGEVGHDHFERGLLGFAFHPDYAENGYFYIYHTAPASDGNILKRYQVSDDNPDEADMDSGVDLLRTHQEDVKHHGGHLIFGPDGYLYLSIGDGRTEGSTYAQDLTNLFGTILRLDVSDPNLESPYYRIPADNPFVNDPDARPEIWVYGLRNAWRYDFAPQSGDIYISDVGEFSYEEINSLPIAEAGGANFGWHWFEGDDLFVDEPRDNSLPDNDPPTVSVPDPLPDNLVFPVEGYAREGGKCAIIGGVVYQGTAIPELRGKYLYTDLCDLKLRALSQNSDGTWRTEIFLTLNEHGFISSFAEDSQGEIYMLYISKGVMVDLFSEWQKWEAGHID